MSVVFPINDDDRFQIYALAAAQVLVSVPFPFQDNRDIRLIRVSSAGAAALLAEPADYALTGAGAPSGGQITLVAPGTAGETLQVIGRALLERVTSIVRSGKFASAPLDADLDRTMLVLQELRRDADRAVKAPLGSTAPDLPAPEEGRALVWGTSGELLNAAVGEGDIAVDVAAAQAAAVTAVAQVPLAVAARGGAETAETNAEAALAAVAAYGHAINLEGAIEHAVSFTVGAPDLSILHILTPATGTTLQVTLPPATSHVGKAIAFLVPRNTSGLVQFLATLGQPASLIADYSTDDFWVWNGETVTLFAHSGVWQIADWRKNKLHIEVSMPATNIALTAGVSSELSGWVAPAWDATHLRHYKFALDGGAPQKIVLPRRGLWEVEVEAFVTFSGTAPTYLWMDLSGPAGFGAIANRRYADFIQTATPTQAVLHYRGRVFQNAKGTVIAPWIQIGGTPTSPIIAAVTSQPRMRLTEVN